MSSDFKSFISNFEIKLEFAEKATWPFLPVLAIDMCPLSMLSTHIRNHYPCPISIVESRFRFSER